MKKSSSVILLISLFFFLLPKIYAQSNQTVVNGSATTPENFSGAGCTYNWINNNPSIGLSASGAGNIASFTALNNGSSPVTATITATSAQAGFAYITNSDDGTVSVVNTKTNSVEATIKVGNNPTGVASSPDGKMIYIANSGSGTVSIINASNNTVSATVTVGSGPESIAVSPDGGEIFVVNQASIGYNNGTVSVVNTSTDKVISTIEVGYEPQAAVISPDGNLLYVTNYYYGTVSVINTATNTVINTIQVSQTLGGEAISPHGDLLYVVNDYRNQVIIINTATNAIEGTIPVGNQATEIAISPDGTKGYVTNFRDYTISVIDLTTDTVTKTISVGSYPVGVSVSTDGEQVYVANSSSNSVSVINATENTVQSTITVGSGPVSFGSFVAGSPCQPLNFTITVNPSPAAVPSIAGGIATGTISACFGTASASPSIQQFTVSGSNLSENVIATAPQGFEVSLSANSGFGNAVSLAPTNGSIANSIIYVRAGATAAVGNITGNVVLSSAGAPNEAVGVLGVIIPLPTITAIPNQTVAGGLTTTAIDFSGAASTFSWINDTPGIGLATSGTGDIAPFTAINAGNSPITATITATPLNSENCNGLGTTFTITVNPVPPPPTITTSAALTPLTTVYGTPSVAESFTVLYTSINSEITVNPPNGFEVSSDGIVFETAVVLTPISTAYTATLYLRLAPSAPVGNYSGSVIVSTANATSLNILMPVSTVTPAKLLITADNKSRPFETINPPLTVTYTGFVNNDSALQLTALPAVTTSATLHSAVGQYPIIASGAVSPNYVFTYQQGVLDVVPSLLSIPSAFTPNGDGINDTWEIKYLEYYTNATVNIFNRWGQLVFGSVGYPIPWDGTYQGKLLAVGTYYYIIDTKGGGAIISGWVAIVR